MLSAEVLGSSGNFSPEFDHMALLVTLEERWLEDVGFGDSFVEPLRLDERGEQAQGRSAYRFDEAGEGRFLLLRRDEGGEWIGQYRFSLVPHVYSDYADRCRYHQTSPESHFMQGRVCSLALPDGRVTLSRIRLITTHGGERQERELAGDEEYAAALRELFGIVLPVSALADPSR
jgi:N-hydroxyarylamine O-acetyltransferase